MLHDMIQCCIDGGNKQASRAGRICLSSTYHCIHADGNFEEAGIRGDHLEGQLGGCVGRLGEVEGVVPRDARVEDTEAVLARLDVEERPGLAVDVDHVAPGARLLLQLRLQRPVLVVELGAQDERDVELAVAGGEAEGVLGWIC